METIDAGWGMCESGPTEAREYREGVAKADRPRITHPEYGPLSQFRMKAPLPMMGWSEVLVRIPESQAAAVSPGALVRHDGGEVEQVRGGDFGSVSVRIVVGRLTPAGDGIAVLEQAVTSNAKATEAGQRGDTK